MQSAEIYAGETYDARAEVPGWTTDSPSETAAWTPASNATPPSDTVLVTSHAILPPIGVRQRFSPCDMWQSSPGVYVFDFCQNMAGYTILNIPTGAATAKYAGLNVSIQHAEAIHGPPPAAIFHHYSNTAEVCCWCLIVWVALRWQLQAGSGVGGGAPCAVAVVGFDVVVPDVACSGDR